jgi:hypothetical protein
MFRAYGNLDPVVECGIECCIFHSMHMGSAPCREDSSLVGRDKKRSENSKQERDRDGNV